MSSGSPLTPGRALRAAPVAGCSSARQLRGCDDGPSEFLTDLAESIAGACMQSLYTEGAVDPIETCGRVEVTVQKSDGHFRRLHEIEADIIRLAFIRYEGRVSEIARRLNVSRSTMYRKLDAMGLGSGKPD